MEEKYKNAEKETFVFSSQNQRGRRSSERRFHGVIILLLGLLSVFLLAGLICLSALYDNSVCGPAAELEESQATLTERLQESNTKLISVIEERDKLRADLTEHLQESNTKLLSAIEERDKLRADLTEHLQESNTKLISAIEERDQLKAVLAECLQESNTKPFSPTEVTYLYEWTEMTEMTEEPECLHRLSEQNRTCPSGWRMLNCTCYFFSTTTASWEQSRQDCRDKGADLVIIESYEEQEMLHNLIEEITWIGLNDRENEGVWKWVDETPLTQGYWENEQPDNGGGDPQWGEEDCVQMKHYLETEESWNDRRCDASLQWICEKLP